MSAPTTRSVRHHQVQSLQLLACRLDRRMRYARAAYGKKRNRSEVPDRPRTRLLLAQPVAQHRFGGRIDLSIGAHTSTLAPTAA